MESGKSVVLVAFEWKSIRNLLGPGMFANQRDGVPSPKKNMGFPGFSQITWDFPAFPPKKHGISMDFPGVSKNKKNRGKPPTAPPRCLLVTRKALRGDRDGIYRDGGDGGNGPDGDGNDEDMVGLWLMQTRCDDHHALNMYIYIHVWSTVYAYDSSWWLNQPIWKICEPSKWIISPGFGVKTKHISNHHLDIIIYMLYILQYVDIRWIIVASRTSVCHHARKALKKARSDVTCGNLNL